MFDLHAAAEVARLYGNALPAAILMAITFSIFGIFVVLKRMVFIGITLSEVAACGVAAALLLNLSPFLGAAALCLAVVALLAYPYESTRIPRDTILGSIFIMASGMSILLVARSGFGLEKVKAILYGNLLFASNSDLFTIAAVMVPALLLLLVFYRPLLYTFIDRESAQTVGIKVWRYELSFFILLGLIVASSSKIAGVMLVFCYLVIPAGAALLFTRSMGRAVCWAVSISVLATWLGIVTSYNADLPPNQLIAVISCVILLIAAIFHYSAPLLGKKYAISIAAAAFSILLIFLNGLTIKEANAANEKSLKGSVQSSDTKKMGGWPGKIIELEQVLQNDPQQGRKMMINLLEQQPPMFFADEIIAVAEKHLKVSRNVTPSDLLELLKEEPL